jgi:hypothetical protein
LYSVRIALLQRQQDAEQRRKAKELKKQQEWVNLFSWRLHINADGLISNVYFLGGRTTSFASR